MLKQLLPVLAVFFGAALPTAYAQNFSITYQTPDQLVVCSADTLRITIQNNTTTPVSGALLDLELPGGLEYLPGSAGGAAESDISNLQKPVLAPPVLLPGVPVTVTVQLYATCGLVPAINSAQLFSLLLRVRAGAVTEQVTTSTFQIQTSLLVITQVDNDSISGEKGQVLMRTLHVQNTRLGAVKHLFLSDAHPAGINLHVAGAAVEQNTSTLYTARFDGAFFTAFGDGDTLLEFGETALIKEEILIQDCGIPSFTCRSNLVTGWSCAPSEPPCQNDSTYADVVIKESKLQPKLVFKTQYALPWDICAQIPVEMKVQVINVGPVAATNIFLQIRSEDPARLAMDKTSFRLRKSNGTQPLVPNLAKDSLMPDCGVKRSASVTLFVPQLDAQDTMEILFNNYFCDGACQQNLPKLLLNYFYNKPCPAGGFVSADTVKFERRNGDKLDAYVSYDIGDCLQDGQTYPFTYLISSNRLKSDSGYLWLKLDVPVGMEWSPDCPPLAGGKAPAVFSINPAVTDYPVNRVLMAWPLPLSDTLAVDFCLKNTCRSDGSYVSVGGSGPDAAGNFIIYQPTNIPCTNCGYEVKTAALLTLTLDQNLACAVPACDSFKLQTACVCDTSGGGPGGGGGKCLELREYNNAQRLNYDLPDNDNDRQADPGGALDMNKVRRDRFLPGDTLRHIMSTKVVCGDSINKLLYTLYTEVIASDYGYGAAGDTFDIGPGQGDAARYVFTNKNLTQIVQASFSIWDSSANTVYSCPIESAVNNEQLYGQVAYVNTKPLDYIDELTTMNFSFRPDMADFAALGCVPPGFLLEAGDSVWLEADMKLDFNYTPNCKQHFPPLINFETGYSRNGRFYNYRQSDTLMFQYSGYVDTLTTNTFGIKPCENSVEVSPFSYKIRIARENLFPYEVRPLSKVGSYDLVMPKGVTPISAELQYLNLQENTPRLANLPLPFSVTDTVLHVDFSPAYANPPDEGYNLRTHVVFAPSCEFTRPDSSALYITLDFPGCMHKPNPDIHVLENKIGFFSNHPRDTVTINETVVDFPTPAVSVDLFFQNQAPVVAPNYWVQLVNPEGGLTGITLTLAPGATVLPVNGIYQLGALGILGQKQVHVAGENSTCDPQHVLVIYGWDCQPHTQPDAFSCGIDTLELLFRPQNPEIELHLLDLPAQAPLCDSSDYIVFEISNADLGYAYHPIATVELPTGFGLVPGSCQLAYPAGSTFVPFPDPVPAGSALQWDLAALQASIGANGLPGVNMGLQNAVQIRFKVLAECGVVSNAQLVFGARAEWSCGKPTNTLRKASNPLPVEGLTPSYGVQISLTETGGGPVACGVERTLNANLILSGMAQPGDSIYVVLPGGYGYVPGSYLAGVNAPAGAPDIEGSILRWPAPPNLTPGVPIAFSFRIVADSQSTCSGATVRMYTRQRSAAYCPIIMANCVVYIATGETEYPLPPADPDVVITAATTAVGADGLTDLTLVFQNNGSFDVPPPVYRIYHDLDGDGALSAADTLLVSGSLSGNLAPGGEETLNLPNAFSGLAICRLLVVLLASDNCDCNDVVYPLANNDVTYSLQHICTGQNTLVGVPPMTGHTYAWSGLSNLPCTDCSQFLFGPAPGGLYPLTLTDTSGTCIVQRHFTVQVNERPVLLSNDTTVCRGQAVTLMTSPAVAWQWTGPGIGVVTTPTLTVLPVFSDTFSVVATTAAGCTLQATVVVHGIPLDTTYQTAQTCAGTPIDMFGTLTDVPGLYVQPLTNARGCDSLLFLTLEVLPNTSEERFRCIRDTLTVFGKPITAAGTYCEAEPTSLGCSIQHCVVVSDLPEVQLPDPDTFYVEIRKSVQLPSPGIFTSYHWAPADSLSCTDCPSPFASPTDTTDYTVTVTNTEGCTDTLVYRVVPYPPCDAGRIKIPNAFTPNGDGNNDVFTVVPYEGVEVIERLTIFNRWGQKIYETAGPNAVWDGTVDGKPAPADVYVWLLEVRCSGEEKAVRHGDVALIR